MKGYVTLLPFFLLRIGINGIEAGFNFPFIFLVEGIQKEERKLCP
jgi:hypothetical protein